MLSICMTIKNRYYNGMDNDITCMPLYNSLFSIHLVRNQLKSIFGDFEVIISDFHSTDYDLSTLNKIYPFNNMKLKIVKTPDDRFSRGGGLNTAYENSKGIVIFFSDVDMVVENIEFFTRMKEVTDQGNVFTPYVLKRNVTGESGIWTKNGCGICAVPRDVVDQVGGFIDKKTYGHEDIDFLKKCLNVTEVIRERNPGLVHYPHSRIPWKDV